MIIIVIIPISIIAVIADVSALLTNLAVVLIIVQLTLIIVRIVLMILVLVMIHPLMRNIVVLAVLYARIHIHTAGRMVVIGMMSHRIHHSNPKFGDTMLNSL